MKLSLIVKSSLEGVKRIVFILALLCITLSSAGQQHPSLDNYLFSPIAISPAHAGLQKQQVVSLVDAQWVGMKGAPRTGFISFDFRNLRGLGLNFTIINDQIGPVVTQQGSFSAAYHLKVSSNTKLSTGLRMTLGRTAVDLVDETYFDFIDPNIYNLQGPLMANIDLGTTLHTSNYYTGISFKNVNRGEIYQNNYSAQVLQIFGGYNHIVSSSWTLRSSFLLSATTNSPADLNFHLFFEQDEEWGIGPHYSPLDEMGIIFRISPSKDWHIFYQYNYPLTELVYITKRSHVIGLAFNIVPRVESFTSPRLFL